jgi:integrase
MRLKNSGVSEDVISEALGHKDLATTKVYLDSFGNDEIAIANELL